MARTSKLRVGQYRNGKCNTPGSCKDQNSKIFENEEL